VAVLFGGKEESRTKNQESRRWGKEEVPIAVGRQYAVGGEEMNDE